MLFSVFDIAYKQYMYYFFFNVIRAKEKWMKFQKVDYRFNEVFYSFEILTILRRSKFNWTVLLHLNYNLFIWQMLIVAGASTTFIELFNSIFHFEHFFCFFLSYILHLTCKRGWARFVLFTPLQRIVFCLDAWNWITTKKKRHWWNWFSIKLI